MRIGRGQTFYEALDARGVPHEDIMTLVEACRSFRNLTKVRQGERFRIHVAPDGGLRSLGFDLDEESYVTWVREGDTYERRDGTYPVEYRVKGVSGTIEQSLYASLQELDAPLALAPKMNDILGWGPGLQPRPAQGRHLPHRLRGGLEGSRSWSAPARSWRSRSSTAAIPSRAFRYTNSDDRPGYFDPRRQEPAEAADARAVELLADQQQLLVPPLPPRC